MQRKNRQREKALAQSTQPSDDLKLFKGHVTHKRKSPVEHSFKYSFFQVWLNIQKPNLIDNISFFWSSKKTNLVRYNRDHYLPNKNESSSDLHSTICHKIHQQTNKIFTGNIFLLASLSYWGYCYNPVSFYLCYDSAGKLVFILSEIHNTPWGERFTYVHDVSSTTENKTSDKLQFKFDKEFHVSPFMPMDLQYDWQFRITPEKILISMNLHQQSESIFNATLDLKAEPLTRSQANKLPFRYPFMCLKVLTAIYWNAFRLWRKKITFHDHPNS